MRDSTRNNVLIVVGAIFFTLLLSGFFVFKYTIEPRQRMLAYQAESARHAAASLDYLLTHSDNVLTPEEEAAIRPAIETLFALQQDAWNRGDVEAFMEHYWKDNDLTFSAGGQTTRGWQATLDRYKERYPTRDAMGRLTLGEFELFPLGDSAALVLGIWKLDRENEPVSGNFSLVLRKIDGRWVIMHDHTSRLAE